MEVIGKMKIILFILGILFVSGLIFFYSILIKPIYFSGKEFTLISVVGSSFWGYIFKINNPNMDIKLVFLATITLLVISTYLAMVLVLNNFGS